MNRFGNCCAIRRSLRRIGSIANTITWCAPARSLGPVPMPRSFACAKRTKFWPRRPIAIRSIAGSIRARAARIAVAEAARNLTCSGATPLAVTDNLNFGNPYKPENFWQLREAVEGVAEACRAFGTPVIGGNVSLYNESPAGVVDPTPTVAMVGLIDEERHITTQYFKDDGDVIILVGEVGDELGASHFLKVCHGRKEGLPPRLEDRTRTGGAKCGARSDPRRSGTKRARLFRRRTRGRSRGMLFQSRSLVRRASRPGTRPNLRADQLLFNESQSRIVISVAPENENATTDSLTRQKIPFQRLGTRRRRRLSIRANEQIFSWPIAEIYDDWFNAFATPETRSNDSQPLPRYQ